jgi:hypothetical protein
VKYFKDNSKNLANLVTADGGFEWKDENLQEQEVFPLVIGEILTALYILAKGGNFICKVYETFTQLNVKLLCLLGLLFKSVYIVKPLMSHKSNSERYVVCIGLGDDKHKEKIIKILEELLSGIEIEATKKKYLNDIFPTFNMPINLRTMMIAMNTDISNRQFQSMNEIIRFVNEQNYRGDEYNKRRQMQIDAAKYWVNLFYPTGKIKDHTDKLEKFTKEIVDSNVAKAANIEKKVDYN